MIGYVTIGTNDFDNALAFYDALFESIGVKQLWKHGSMAAWARSREDTAFCLIAPYDGEAATAGNGVMVALKMQNSEQVDTLYARAIALGAKDEGEPGPRGDSGFYGAYFRDLEGNKLNAYIPG